MHWCAVCALCVSICVSSADAHAHSFVSPRTPHTRVSANTHAQVLQLGGGPANVSNISRMHVLAPVADMVLGSCVFTTVFTTVLTCACSCRPHGTWCLCCLIGACVE
jgi:hypothetical protein